MKPKAIKELQQLPVNMVGDGKSPNLFFVTQQGVVITITRSFEVAYNHWKTISNCNEESMLEDRRFGVICSVEPESEESTKLRRIDDSYQFLKYHPQHNY